MERPYEKLIAWKESFSLCIYTYKLTKMLPPDERFGLTAQMRRSAGSIPMNIAEGNSKRSQKEKAHFFEISLCSLEELHCQYKICLELDYISAEDFEKSDALISKTGFLINKLRAAVIR